MYRGDASRDVDWSAIASAIPVDRPVVRAAASSRGSVLREYLDTTMRPSRYYSVVSTVREHNEEGQLVQREEEKHWQLITTVSGTKREKTVHMWRSSEEIRNVAPVAWRVQFMDTWAHDSRPEEHGTVRVMPESDPEWVTPERIAPFEELAHNLYTYDTAIPDAEQPGTVVLSGRHRAKPNIPIMDAKCQVSGVVWELEHQGWTPLNARVGRTDVPGEGAPKQYDGRVECKMKFYYQTLLDLPSPCTLR